MVKKDQSGDDDDERGEEKGEGCSVDRCLFFWLGKKQPWKLSIILLLVEIVFFEKFVALC